MDNTPIKSETEYRQALARIDTIFDAKKNSLRGDELEMLSILVEKYENEHFPFEQPEP